MREIKFRAWDTHRKMMLTKIEVLHFGHNSNGSNVEQVYGYNPTKQATSDANWVALSSLVLMQYTGLKDKNGVEIYEGDIVHTYKKKGSGFGGRDFDIRWNADTGTYGMFDGDTFQLSTYAYEAMMKDCKVIGNVYENAELLEATK